MQRELLLSDGSDAAAAEASTAEDDPGKEGDHLLVASSVEDVLRTLQAAPRRDAAETLSAGREVCLIAAAVVRSSSAVAAESVEVDLDGSERGRRLDALEPELEKDGERPWMEQRGRSDTRSEVTALPAT